MIAYIRGKVMAQTAETVVVDVHGIGYEIFRHSKDFGTHRGSFQTAIGELSRLSRQSIYYLTFNIRIIL